MACAGCQRRREAIIAAARKAQELLRRKWRRGQVEPVADRSGTPPAP